MNTIKAALRQLDRLQDDPIHRVMDAPSTALTDVESRVVAYLQAEGSEGAVRTLAALALVRLIESLDPEALLPYVNVFDSLLRENARHVALSRPNGGESDP